MLIIYQLEANPRYLPFTDPIFGWLERRESRAVTSTITMTELLAQLYRDSDQRRVDEFYGLLSTYPNLEWIAPSLEIADLAARLRALHRQPPVAIARRVGAEIDGVHRTKPTAPPRRRSGPISDMGPGLRRDG